MKKRRPRFWIGPLLAGGCLAIGHNFTERILILKGGWDNTEIELFSDQRPFPGKRLKALIDPKATKTILIVDSNQQEDNSNKIEEEMNI